MILPDITARALHARRRVTAIPTLKSMNLPTTAIQAVREARCNGIIRLTFTA